MGARDQLRAHFLGNIGKIMDSSELQEVAGGITEWAPQKDQKAVLKWLISKFPVIARNFIEDKKI